MIYVLSQILQLALVATAQNADTDSTVPKLRGLKKHHIHIGKPKKMSKHTKDLLKDVGVGLGETALGAATGGVGAAAFAASEGLEGAALAGAARVGVLPGVTAGALPSYFKYAKPPKKDSKKSSPKSPKKPAPKPSKKPSPKPKLKAWSKCGGERYKGLTTCQPGFVCEKQTKWYSQCRPTKEVKTTPLPSKQRAKQNM
eukprot:g3715.t1